MSGHTPGPWVIIPGGDEWSSGRIATIEPKPETMADVNYWIVAEVNYRRDEHAANANLIAAAPDLLEALEAFVEHNSSEEMVTITVKTADVAKARKAIARAKGKA